MGFASETAASWCFRTRRLVCVVAVAFTVPSLAFGQAAGTPKPEIDHSSACPLTPGEYQNAGYVIRRVKVHNVFNLFRVLDPLSDASKVMVPRENTPFRVAEANSAASALTDLLHGRPEENESPIVVTAVVNFIDNCTESNGERRLDLIYTTLTNRVPLASGVTLESREKIAEDAPEAIGAVRTPRLTLHAAPRVSYTASDHVQAGGTVAVRAPMRVFDTVAGDAWGSSSSHVLRGSLAGAYDGAGVIKHSDWRFSGSDVERPTGLEGLLQKRVMGQVSAQTRPAGKTGVVFRFGGSVEGGRDDVSDSPALVAPGALSETGYAAARMYAGLSLNLPRHTLAGSYGFAFGAVADGPRVDYRKSIVDVAYGFRGLVGDHRGFELETRAAAGWLQTPGNVPQIERFFGGNVAQDFMEGDTWRIRAAPMIRSFPNGTLNRVLPGAPVGGTNFFSVNLTLSVPVWRIPLVPTAISSLPEFSEALDSAKGTAREATKSYYRARDPAQKLVVGEAMTISETLERLLGRLEQIKPGVPPAVQERFDTCLTAVDMAQGFMMHLEDTGYGPITTSIVPELLRDCREGLGTDVQDAMVNTEYMRLSTSADVVAKTLTQIDEMTVGRKTEEDLGFAFRALDTVVHEVNGLSIGPLVIVDVARIGPQIEGSGGGVRYGIGGGVRVSVMNVININVAYVKNPSPRAWESPGAMFASLEFVDLFR
jgi:hypothetical protein